MIRVFREKQLIVDHCTALSHGVHVLDSAYLRARFDAIYLIVENGRVALVETGTAQAVPRVLAALAELGLTPDAVDWILLTHVHLDHAGGAGAMMEVLNNARLVVHPRGARHMQDPARLWQASAAVYGEAFVVREYGVPVRIAGDRILEAPDGLVLSLAGREIKILHTPGHARHHMCFWDARSLGWFTGDAFGLAYPEAWGRHGPWLLPATTPSQFEPDAMRASIEAMLRLGPERLYLTHFGEVTGPPRLARDLLRQIEASCAMAKRVRDQADPDAQFQAIQAGLKALAWAEAKAQGCELEEAALMALCGSDLVLNAQGLQGWLNG